MLALLIINNSPIRAATKKARYSLLSIALLYCVHYIYNKIGVGELGGMNAYAKYLIRKTNKTLTTKPANTFARSRPTSESTARLNLRSN